MRIVTAQELESWLESGEVVEKDARGPKVVRLQDERLLKIFRPRRRFWLARLIPQANQFAANAKQLAALGVVAPQIEEYFWLNRRLAVSGCLYIPLPGCSLDQLYKRSRSDFIELLPALGSFIYSLHQSGIYFRSLHLGNVLHLPGGGFGLIDFLDMRFYRRPLPKPLVRRNLRHLQGYLQRSHIQDFPWNTLLAAYGQAGSAAK